MSRYDIDKLTAALAETVSQFRDPQTGERGAGPIARRINMNPTTLRHKSNPDDDHQFSVFEVVALCLATDDYRALHAFCAAMNHAAYRLPNAAEVDDDELLDSVLAFSKEGGDAMEAIQAALAKESDGGRRVTAREYEKCDREFTEAFAALATLRSRLRERVVDPEHLPADVTQLHGGE